MIETQETFAEFVARRFGGKLYKGSHSPDGKACLHEAINVWQGKRWSDDTSGTLDLRGLNDAPWSSDEARTAAMLPLGPLVLAWPNWTPERRQTFARRVSTETIRRVLPIALLAAAKVHPDETHRERLTKAADDCATSGSESAAESAARSAESAARSARSAAAAAASAAARSAAAAAASAAAAWSAAASVAWSARSAAARSAAAAASAAASAAWSARSAAAAAASAAAASDEPLRLIAAILLEAAEATA